jgi:O-acetyl-ADP-ribose deacetylase (regulator of RNase III)
MVHGKGLAAAIARKGGNAIRKESADYIKKNGPIPTGASGVTSAGNMPSKYVIHTVGPLYK